MKRITIQGFFLLCIANGLLNWSLEYITGGLAAIIAALVPLFISLFSIWLLKYVKFTGWMVAGLVIGFGGVVVIFYDYLHYLADKSFAFGVVLALLSTVSWAFGTVYASKKALAVDIMFNVGLQMLVAG